MNTPIYDQLYKEYVDAGKFPVRFSLDWWNEHTLTFEVKGVDKDVMYILYGKPYYEAQVMRDTKDIFKGMDFGI